MYDVVIIGAGPGGYVAALRAAQLGLNTALVEKGKTLGGTCLNVGCIPSKCLLQSSELYENVQKHGSDHGIQVQGLSFDLAQMMKRKEAVVESLTSGVSGLIKKNKITRLEGEASFLDPQTLVVGKEKIAAKNFIIATGSEPIALPFLPFDEKKIVSSTGALELKEVPRKLTVVGGGVIGVELASVYARLGSEVTIIEMLDTIIPMMDKDICKAFTQILTKMGMKIHVKSKVLSAEGTTLQVEPIGKVEADVVLVAVGRRPYTKGLGLDKIGLDEKISVNGNFQTKHPHIYAIGDVIDGPMLAHKASEEGVAVAELIAGGHPHVNYMAIPNVIYTHPEVASVGMTEQEAQKAGLELLTGKFFFRGNARARCAGETDGIVKVIGEKKSGRLLGLHIVGAHASEMISEGMIALEKRATVSDIALAPAAHPTLSEAIKEAALDALGRVLHA